MYAHDKAVKSISPLPKKTEITKKLMSKENENSKIEVRKIEGLAACAQGERRKDVRRGRTKSKLKTQNEKNQSFIWARGLGKPLNTKSKLKKRFLSYLK